MSNLETRLREDAAVPERDRPEAAEVIVELRAVLQSPAFLGSKRSQQFLRFVCEKSLAGEFDSLKERSLAIEVFGRRPQSDLADDTIVRVGAREVRKRLTQYYSSPDGLAAAVRIALPSGSYAPEFRYAPLRESEVAAPTVLHQENTGRPKTRLLIALLILVGIAATVLAVRWNRTTPNQEIFARFWEPVFKSSDPMLLALAHPIVYHPSGRVIRKSEENRPPANLLIQRPVEVGNEALTGADLVPVLNQYVGVGDMVAANEVSTMLSHRSKNVRLRLASGLEFADLRKAQVLLIGAYTNRWTMQMQQAWRFQFGMGSATKPMIVDTAGQQQWSMPSKEDGSADEDYILVCRIRNSDTGGFIIAAAGLKQFGTEAAGRLLADADQLGPILSKLPPGWDAKNLELVLHARVIANTPAQPQMVAAHAW